jgi:DNA gyrase subunit A
MADRAGRAIRFNEDKVRTMGRVSTGVRGMTLADDNDEVIGMIAMKGTEDETVMVVSENGYGKRTNLEDYRITNRGGKGVKTLSVTDKTGNLVAIKNVDDTNDLMIINQSGVTLRMHVADIKVQGRATQGVKLIDLGKRGDTIASVCKVDAEPEEEETEAPVEGAEVDMNQAETSTENQENTIE